MATGTALGVVAVTAMVGMLLHARAGDVRARQGLLFTALGVLAAAAMAPVNARLPEAFLVAAVVVLMAIVAVRMWRQPSGTAERKPTPVVIAARLAA